MGRFINADSYASTGQGVLGNNMFAYCLNNPVCRVEIGGYASEEADLDDNTKDELFIQPQGGISTGNTNGEPTITVEYGPNTPNNLSFKSTDALMEHNTRHNGDFGNVFKSPQEYVDTANYVIQNGEYIPGQNAYVKFYGMNGHGNYAFVGVSRDHTYITTFHLKPACQIQFG